MPPQLSSKLVIEKDLLESLVVARLSEARALFNGGFFSGAIHLGGYAVECQLKATICRSLRLDSLPGTFKTHDLELLLLHCGLHGLLNARIDVADSFKKICGMWDPGLELRYAPSGRFRDNDARLFLDWVDGTEAGVVPWLRRTA